MFLFKIKKEVLLVAFQTVLIVSVTLFSVVPFSCKISEEGIEIIGGDYENPCLENVSVVDDRTVCLEFSDSVSVRSAVVSEFIDGVSDSDEHSETFALSPSLAAACGEYGKIDVDASVSEDGKIVTFVMNAHTEVGKKYEVFGTVEDDVGNSLTFCVPFVGFNQFVPRMIITEAQVKYGKGSVNGETVYRTEFVELLALEDGNLAGLELVSASDGEAKCFVFPAVEVKKGEVILVHPRTKEKGCVNEIGDDLNLASAAHSKDGVRDLWAQNENSCYNDNSDVIYLRDSVAKRILDAVVYAGENVTEWKGTVAETMQLLVKKEVCDSADVTVAVCSKGVSPLKSISRNPDDCKAILEMTEGGEDYIYPIKFNSKSWSVCSATPGEI